jgi:hypothetical protein
MAFFNKFKNIFSRENKSQEDKDLEKKKLDNSLNKTKNTLFEKISKTIVGKSKIDDNDLDDFEEILISSDIGVETTLKIINNLQSRVKKDKFINTNDLYSILKEEISNLFNHNKNLDTWGALFGESLGRILVSVKPQDSQLFEESMMNHECNKIGKVTSNDMVIFNNRDQIILSANVKKLRDAWKGTLNGGNN